MLSGQVVPDKLGGIEGTGFLQALFKPAGRGLCHQIRLGGEVLVETAVSEAGRPHQIRHSHAIVTPFAKQLGCGGDYVCPVCLSLCLGDPHTRSSSESWKW
ncbi:hypothetical protein D3C79_712220 [compost metagenome]